MKAGDLIKGLKGVRLLGSEIAEIESICYDSRRVGKNALYVAITGLRTDGRRFAQDAIARGATAIASESIDGLPAADALIEVKNARKFLAEVSARFTGYPDKEMIVIGATGTNGKTTTTYLLGSILNAWGRRTGIIGTTGFFDGKTWTKLEHTTPESADLWSILAGMRDSGCKACAIEISSHSVELNRVWGLDVDAAIFTNLTQDHLDFHKDMESYKMAKFRLFEELKTDAVAVINADDKTGLELLERLSGRKTVSFSTQTRGTDLWIEVEYANLEGTALVIHHRGLALPCLLKLPGLHNVSNLAAAAGAALSVGIEPEALKKGVEALLRVPGRLDPVENEKGFFIFVDYAHTPDALQHLVRTARELGEGRVITLFGCGGDRDKGKRPQMGRIASKLSDFVFVTSDNPRTEKPSDIIDEILAGVEGDGYKVIEDRREAIFAAVGFLKPGDALLIAGKGHEDYQILGTEKIHFDDREVVKEALLALP